MKLIITKREFGSRDFMWNCIDYDGGPDAGFVAHIHGWGDTPAIALQDWQEQWDDYILDMDIRAEEQQRIRDARESFE